jgi:hypothetical protein
MLVAMVNIYELKKSILYVVIERDNLARMEKADPFTLESVIEGGVMPKVEFPENFSMLLAYEPDQEELMEMARRGGVEFMRYLERGRVWKPGVDGVEYIRTVTEIKPE